MHRLFWWSVGVTIEIVNVSPHFRLNEHPPTISTLAPETIVIVCAYVFLLPFQSFEVETRPVHGSGYPPNPPMLIQSNPRNE